MAAGLGPAITKAVLKSTKKGAKGAVVKKPGQQAAKDLDAGVTPPETPLDAPPQTPKQPVEAPKTPDVAPTAPDVKARAAALETLDKAGKTKPSAVKPALPETPALGSVEDEADRLLNLSVEDFTLDESLTKFFDNVGTTDDVKAIMFDTADTAAAQGILATARRGKVTLKEMDLLAADLDLERDVVEAVMNREVGGVLTDVVIRRARRVVVGSAMRIKQLSKKIAEGEATAKERITFRRQQQLHTEFFAQFMGARAESGRSLNAFKGVVGDDIGSDELLELSRVMDNLNGYDTDKLAKEINMLDSVGAITKTVRKYNQAKFMGTVNELFINSLLSGPKTHVINTGGNVGMQLMAFGERAIAARIGKFFSGEDHVLVGEASALMHGTISAWRDGLRLGWRSMKTGTALDDVVKYEGVRRRSISADNLLSPEFRNTPIGSFAAGFLDGWRIPTKSGKGIPFWPGLGPTLRSPTERVMIPTDEFFKTLAYRGELERRAFLHAYDQVSSGAIQTSEAAAVARQFMEDTPLKVQKAAEQYTRYVTFQNPLGSTGQKIQGVVRAVPGLSLLAPFVRTPVNLFKAGIAHRSPLALFTSNFWRTMKRGGAERDMMLARVGLGTATTAVIAGFAMDGTITGGGPPNPDARQVLEAKGWRPYSIKVVEPFTNAVKYISYARMEPLAFIIGATADAVEIGSFLNSDLEFSKDSADDINNLAAAIITGVVNNTMSKTFVKGLADFTEMLSDPKRYAESYFRQTIPNFIPFAALRSQLAQIEDPYLREAWTLADQIRMRSGIPGFSQDAPPRRDIFGEPRVGRRGELLGPMSPMPSSEEKFDPILDEVIRVMEATRTVPITSPGRHVQGLRLNANEYDKLIINARLLPNSATGRTFKEELQRVMESAVYLDASPDMQSEIIKRVQVAYDKIGRAMLEEDDPAFEERLELHIAKRNRLRFGE